MLSARLGAGSVAASLTGLLALTGDMTTIAASLGTSHIGLSPAFQPVFSAANLTGFLLGLLACHANRWSPSSFSPPAQPQPPPTRSDASAG